MTTLDKPNVFRTGDGQYVNDKDLPLTVVNRMFGNDPATWVYADADGNIYSPKNQPHPSYLGEITQNDKRVSEDNPNLYFDPIRGAGLRWRASMSNGTNPFIGLGKTFGRAAEWYMGKSLLGYGLRGINTIKNITDNGKKIYKAYKLAAPFVKGAVGANVVDQMSQDLTGNTWSGNLSPYLGQDLSEMLNPGYFLGGVHSGIADDINRAIGYYRFSKKYPTMRNKAQNAVSKKLLLVSDNRTRAEEELKRRKALFEDILKKFDTDYVMLPHISSWKRLARANNRDVYAAMTQPMQEKDGVVTISLADDFSNQPSSDQYVSFIDEMGRKSSLLLRPLIGLGGHPLLRYASSAASDYAGETIQLREIDPALRRKFNLYEDVLAGEHLPVQKSINQYVLRLNETMGDDGTVAGSLIHYKNGIFPATPSGTGTLLGPADTEIYTTAARLPGLKKKLAFNQTSQNSVGGLKGTSPHTFRNTDFEHNGVDTEINIIGADSDGNAVGKLAHQLYRSLHPEEYSKAAYDYAMAGNTKPYYDLPLPISAEDLFLAVNKDPNAMLRSLMADLIGMETFTRPQNMKANKRLFQALFNESPQVQLIFRLGLSDNGKTNMGSRFALGTDLYKNMSFSDVDANALFLLNAYNLPLDLAQRYAKNEGIMRNAVDLYNQSYSTGVRLMPPRIVTERTSSGKLIHDPKRELFDGNSSFGGGNVSGGGLNRALLNPEGGFDLSSGGQLVSVTQTPLTYAPENIKTPMDLLNQVVRILKLGSDHINPRVNTRFPNDSQVVYDDKTAAAITEKARADDMPVNFNMGQYGFGYSGSYGSPIASGLRYVQSKYEGVELGSLLPEIMWDLRDVNKLRKFDTHILYEDAAKSMREKMAEKIRSGLDKYNKLSPKERLDLAKRVYFSTDLTNENPIINEISDKRLLVEGNKFRNQRIKYRLYPLNIIMNDYGSNKESGRAFARYFKGYKQLKRERYELIPKLKKAEREFRQYDNRFHKLSDVGENYTFNHRDRRKDFHNPFRFEPFFNPASIIPAAQLNGGLQILNKDIQTHNETKKNHK